MRNSFLTLAGISVLFFVGCKSKVPATGDLISDNVNNAVEQYSLMTNQIEKSGQVLNPRTLDKDGSLRSVSGLDERIFSGKYVVFISSYTR